MSYYHSSNIIISFTLLLICVTFTSPAPTSFRNKLSSRNNDTSLNEHFRLSASNDKLRTIPILGRDRFKSSYEENDDELDHDEDAESPQQHHDKDNRVSTGRTAHVVVLTSLSGVYVWWPTLFGGDDSFHLLLSHEDVPRFHDVTGDEYGHIYLTAPHERTVYRLQYSNGWWVSNFSNHSLMNSIRSEMPLFVTIHHVSSMLYVYGHSDIQTIDLLERSGTRGSAPFMKRLRELSPNLRISDLIIDQLTADGYVIGDSYGWCTIIRCSLAVSECVFLFKIPSSYDNRPYPCTATIDFSTKIMYLSLEEKILAVHLNEQTNYDRRFVLTEKSGPRSTLGYDDIATHNQTVLYTDVLRPVLHICQSSRANRCLNMSLTFASSQRTILPLRMSLVQAPNFRPPIFDDEEDNEHQSDPSESHLPPSSLIAGNRTSTPSGLVADSTSIEAGRMSIIGTGGILMLILGVCIGLVLAGLSFLIYYVTWNKNRPKLKRRSLSQDSPSSPIERLIRSRTSPFRSGRGATSRTPTSPTTDESGSNQLLDYEGSQSITGSTVNTATTTTTSSSSYDPTIVV